MTHLRGLALLLTAVTWLGALPAAAHEPAPAILEAVGFDQRPGAAVPLHLAFRDEHDRVVTLADYVRTSPVVLSLHQYGCRHLCPLVLGGLAVGISELPFVLGRDYAVVSVSIDPRETPAVAARTKQGMVGHYLTPAARPHWHFLTGPEASVRRLADAVGFRYAYDAEEDAFAHPSGVVVLTPDGRVARYLFGLDFPPRDLRLALVEASAGRIGSIVDRAILACYRYDATRGRYTPVVMDVVRASGLLTVVALGTTLLVLLRAERAGRRRRSRR